jgi:hypothetical protein
MAVSSFSLFHNISRFGKLRACLTDPLKGPNPYNNRQNKGLDATRPSSRPRKTAPRVDFL